MRKCLWHNVKLKLKAGGKNLKWIMVLILQKEIDTSEKRLEGSTEIINSVYCERFSFYYSDT